MSEVRMPWGLSYFFSIFYYTLKILNIFIDYILILFFPLIQVCPDPPCFLTHPTSCSLSCILETKPPTQDNPQIRISKQNKILKDKQNKNSNEVKK